MRLSEGTLSGHCAPRGEIADATCLSLHELGSDPNLISNVELLDYIEQDDRLMRLDMFVSGSLENAVRDRNWSGKILHAYTGPSADNLGENTGTYGELEQLIAYNKLHSMQHKPVFVTSGHNIGNVYRQAKLLGIDGIIPADLPHSFDWDSNQLWTKHRALWVLTAKLRIELLQRRGH